MVSKNISHAEILRLSGIETSRNPSSYISQALTQNQTIPFSLADFVLDHSLNAGDPVERAMHSLATAGLKPTDIEILRQMAERMRPTEVQTSAKHLPDPEAHEVVENTKTEARVVLTSKRTLPDGFVAPEKGRTNRRHEYRIVPVVARAQKNSVQIPCFEAVAAGFGEDLERSEDLVHVRELPDWKGMHSLVVRGDSMEDTLHPRDLILIETFNNGDGLTMEGLQPEQDKTPFQQVQKRIPDDEIFVLSIDNEPPTVKRVLYDVDDPHDWHLIIQADNTQYKPRVLRRKTPIRFYGRLIAIGQREGKKQYSDHKPIELPIPKGMKKR